VVIRRGLKKLRLRMLRVFHSATDTALQAIAANFRLPGSTAPSPRDTPQRYDPRSQGVPARHRGSVQQASIHHGSATTDKTLFVSLQDAIRN
jgi:hypothetical protein